MPRRILKLFILVLMVAPFLFASVCQGQTQLKSATISTAGGKTQSNSYKLFSTIGQAVQPVSAMSTNYFVHGNLLGMTRDLELPVIIHSSPTTPVPEGTDISIQATVTDNINVDVVNLHYRQGGTTDFTAIEMEAAGSDYTASVPGSSVGSKGIDYYIAAVDVNGNSRMTDISAIQVTLQGTGITKSTAQTSGSAQSAYRLISLPLDATNKKPANVLEDNLGPYNNTQWRFFELRSDQTYSEHPNTADMNPGKAFWLIVKSADKIIDSGPGKTIPTNTSYSISLAAGWNLIGDPFNFNIPVSNLSLQNDSTLDIRAYNGSWSTFQGSITPYMGYAVYSETATSLLIDPDLSTLPKLPTKNTLAKKNEQDWSIAIEAQCDLALDSDTKAMTHVNAAQKFDSFDRPEPPVIGDFVSVYFPHPEWGKMSSSYCIDARPSLVDGEIWEFAVRANIKENVTLSFKGIENIPDGFEVWVADRDLKIFKNLGKNATYDAGMATVQPKNMLLIVGKPDFIAEKLDGFEMIPKTYVLFQNFPNPFNPTTTIRYGLPKEETVSLRIYNLLGQEVRVLMDREHKMAGYHTAQWDGKNQSGSQVASGMYIYHLQAGSYTNVKKMLLVR